MMRLLPWAYLLAAFVFIYLPVGTLVLFSFQEGGLPVPPFEGPSLRWYGDILSDGDLMGALGNSLMVAFGSQLQPADADSRQSSSVCARLA